MGTPSSQTIAMWIKTNATNLEWRLLQDVALEILKNKLKNTSEDEILDLIESGLPYITNTLRNEAAEEHADGCPPTFAIDDEPSPYFKSYNRETDVLRKLQRINPFTVEELCSRILSELGAESTTTNKTADGGVDFIGKNLNIVPSGLGTPAVCRAIIIGQTKRYSDSNIIKETTLREFVGAGLLKRHQLRLEYGISPLAPVILAFWTTSSFDPNAKVYARSTGIWYMDWQTLANYITALGLKDYVMKLPDA